jgi:hypothetical protein
MIFVYIEVWYIFWFCLSNIEKKQKNLGWIDGLAVKSTNCSSGGPEFNSQNGSQPSLMEFDALFWCVWRQQQCIHMYKINKS